ncbi:MAG: hypothetical protein LBS62_09265 [Clostridiales bacterium]|jgi:hypothetical protein|nr:hypothetical protein [Clostridiales bacterium]
MSKNMILTIYDISGIQNFIFATNKLRETAGASFIISNALFANIPDIFGVDKDAWKEEGKETGSFSFGEKDKQKIVYIGGGNAVVAYDSAKTEQTMTRALARKIFDQAGGTLKLCSASVEADENKTLDETLKSLYDELEKYKRTAPMVQTAGGFSINAHHNETFEPVLLMDEGNGRYSAKSVWLKNQAFEKGGAIVNVPDVVFTTDFEKYRKDGKNYVAVIHIDGNTMGIKIQEFVKKLHTENGKKLLDGLQALKNLSVRISRVYNKVLAETITELVKLPIMAAWINSDGEIPLRPVIADGDDVTVICAAEIAFPFVKLFMESLGQDKSLPEFSAVTAAAGVAFVKFGFPYYTAYEMAEQLCKNAKSETRKRECTDAKVRSSMDFQIYYGGVTSDLATFRKANYIKEGYELHKRPYVFSQKAEEAPSPGVFDYSDFEKCRREIKKYTLNGEPKELARNKAKGLRTAYGKGAEEARIYSRMLRSRDGWDKEPFDGKYAVYFDALDVMDFEGGEGIG